MVPVKSCMVPIEKIVKVDRDVLVKTAAELMRDNGIGSVFITSGDEIIGILTDTDLVRRVVAGGSRSSHHDSRKNYVGSHCID